MNKLAIVLAFLTTFLVGCAAQNTASTAPAATTSNWTGATGTAIDIGDDAALPEVEAVEDEAVEALSDMVAAE